MDSYWISEILLGMEDEGKEKRIREEMQSWSGGKEQEKRKKWKKR